MKKIILCIVLALAPSTARAADKVPVCFNPTTPDTIGTTLAFTVREQLAASQTYYIVLKCADALFNVRMVTVEDDSNNSTAAAVTLAIDNEKQGYDYLVTQWVLVAGREKTAQSATNIIAAIDKAAQPIIKVWASK